MLRRVWCRNGPKCCSASGPSTCDGWLSRRRKGVRNGYIVSVILIESATGASNVGARSPRGRSAVALADDLSVRPLPARATLYARPGPEMAREARSRIDVQSIIGGESLRCWIPCDCRNANQGCAIIGSGEREIFDGRPGGFRPLQADERTCYGRDPMGGS